MRSNRAEDNMKPGALTNCISIEELFGYQIQNLKKKETNPPHHEKIRSPTAIMIISTLSERLKAVKWRYLRFITNYAMA